MTHEEILNLITTMTLFSANLTPTELRTLLKISIAHGKFPICRFCGEPIKSPKELSLDHRNPKAKGGSSRLANLDPMHISCNNLKADLTGKVLEMKKDEFYAIKDFIEKMGCDFNIDEAVAEAYKPKKKKKKHTKRRKMVRKPTNNVFYGRGSK